MSLKKIIEKDINIEINKDDYDRDDIVASKEANPKVDRELILVKGSKMKNEPFRWLWEDWLAQGKLHLLGGAPGAGKTTLAMDIAAKLTAGQNWPDGTKAPTGDAIIWSGEDSYTDTLRPRIDAAGGDQDRIHFTTEIKHGENTIYFNLGKNLSDLETSARKITNLKLIIIDPIVSAVTGDSHRNTEVRNCLEPITKMATKLDVAILGITHFSKGTKGKNPVDRITGSLAFAGVARFVWVVAKGKDREDKEKRILSMAKANITVGTGGYSYLMKETELNDLSVIKTVKIIWQEKLEGEAMEILESIERVNKKSSVEVEEFIEDILQNRPMTSNEFYEIASEEGFSKSTCERAISRLRKKGIDIESYKDGSSWYLRLNNTEMKSVNSVNKKSEGHDGLE